MKTRLKQKFMETEVGKIPEDWRCEPLGKHCTLFVPMRNKPKEFDGNIPWIRIEDLDGKYVSDSKSKQYVTPETVNKMNLRVLPPGTVLCSCTATIGVCAITEKILITNQQFIGIYPNSEINNEFLYYYLLTQKNYLIRIGSGSTIVYISREEFEEFPIILPPVQEQKSIVKILSDLDSKISSLKKQNKILENIIQSTFKSRFIDFDGVTDLIDSELGEIPKGWKVLQIKQIQENRPYSTAMGPFGSNIKSENYVNSGIPVIRGKNIQNGILKEDNFVYLTEDKANELKASNTFPEDVIVVAQGNIGHIGIIPKKSLFQRYVLSQNLMKITIDKNKIDPIFLFYYLKSELGQHQILSRSSQTGVPSISQPLTSLRNILVLIPTKKLLNDFYQISNSIFDKKVENIRKLTTLKKLHESLLPKLMSGQIRV